ncbi:hypothetical protein QBC43DRAFT_284334 [Cladorrhinum sp. PSN259]|nr:hypothetical protein QBC43DRAFT_284334 [Cladorrhinum sp. PSN259]
MENQTCPPDLLQTLEAHFSEIFQRLTSLDTNLANLSATVTNLDANLANLDATVESNNTEIRSEICTNHTAVERALTNLVDVTTGDDIPGFEEYP